MHTLHAVLSIPEEGLIFEAVTYLCGGVELTTFTTSFAGLIVLTVDITLGTLVAGVVVLVLKTLGTDASGLIGIQDLPGGTLNLLTLLSGGVIDSCLAAIDTGTTTHFKVARSKTSDALSTR